MALMVKDLIDAGVRIQLDRALIIFLGFIQLRLRHEELAQIGVDFYVTRIEPQCGEVFLFGFVEPALFLERGTVIVVLARATRQIGHYPT